MVLGLFVVTEEVVAGIVGFFVGVFDGVGPAIYIIINLLQCYQGYYIPL